MSESLLMLRLEHRNTERLLHCLDHQLQLLKLGQPVNSRLMALALEYFEGFPDRCHHPKEDLIYRALQKRSPELADALGDLVQDHERLSQTAQRLAKSFRSPASAEPLATVLEEFVTSYRRHMDAEETRFFPAALESLTFGDWASIDFAVFDRDDPLFHHADAGEFAELRQIISTLDHDEAERIRYHRHARQLEKLQSADDFNQAMAADGHSLRLVRFADQSWGIEDRGNLLYRFPPCSEIRAAWCASLFQRGMIADHGQMGPPVPES